MTDGNLLGPPETRLADDTEAEAAFEQALGDVDLLRAAVSSRPTSSLGWALLSEAVFDPSRPLESYAYARVGYHRGLDSLRKAGWRGAGPVPWSHAPNRGVLRSLIALRRAAAAIGETDEVQRLGEFLEGADPTAIDHVLAERSAMESGAPPTEAIVIRGED